MDWPSMAHGSWHLHGHVHSSGTVYNELNRRQGLMRYDVGVDANGYTPVSLDEIRAWFAGVEYCGRARWWDWVNGTCDPQVVSACNLVREVMCEPQVATRPLKSLPRRPAYEPPSCGRWRSSGPP